MDPDTEAENEGSVRDPRFPAPPVNSGGVAPVGSPLLRCWRCGKLIAPAPQCPFCRADIAPLADPGRASPGIDADSAAASSAVTPIFWVFGIMAISSVILAMVAPGYSEPMSDDDVLRSYHSIAVVELIDVIIILVGTLAVLKTVKLPLRYAASPKLAWAVAAPLLAGVLVANYAYHHVLTSVFGAESAADFLTFERGHHVWLILTICLQPALVEEFFFRYICLGVFEKAVGTGTAIFVSAMIFGAAHIGALASLPILFLIGLVLGYLRVKSGGLALPILFHFLHNLIVSALNFG